MGSNIGKIGDPRLIGLGSFKLSVQDVGCNMAQIPTLKTPVPLIASLRPDASFSHNAVHTVFTARLAVVFHVQRDVSVAIGKPTFNPKLFDLSEQAFVFNGPLALRLVEPAIEPAGVNFQYPTHGRHWILLESCLYERVFFFDSTAKYTAASFNISRSSVTRRS